MAQVEVINLDYVAARTLFAQAVQGKLGIYGLRALRTFSLKIGTDQPVEIMVEAIEGRAQLVERRLGQ